MTAYITANLSCIDTGWDYLLRSMFQRKEISTSANITCSSSVTATATGTAIPSSGLTTLAALIIQNNGTTSVAVDCTVNSVALKFTVPATHILMLSSVSMGSAATITGTSVCRVITCG